MFLFSSGDMVTFIHNGYYYKGKIITTDFIPYAIHNIEAGDGTVYANIAEQQIQNLVRQERMIKK